MTGRPPAVCPLCGVDLPRAMPPIVEHLAVGHGWRDVLRHAVRMLTGEV